MDTHVKMNSLRNNRGFAVIWLALVIPVLLLFVAMAVDFSYMYVTKGQLQNAADAAALAGAQKLVRDDGGEPTADDMAAARTVATQFAQSNKAAGQPVVINSSSDITFGHWDNHYALGGTPVNAIQVRAARDTSSAGGQVPIVFGRFFGWDKMGAVAVATAAIPARATFPFAVCTTFCRSGYSSATPPVFVSYTTATDKPITIETGNDVTDYANSFAWTSFDSNVTSATDTRDLVCGKTLYNIDVCGNKIYSTMGADANVLCNLMSQMYNPYYDPLSKNDVKKGLNTTGWWVTVPVTTVCPPGHQGHGVVGFDPKDVEGYAKVHILAICTGTGCGSGSIKSPCLDTYSNAVPSNVCDLIKTKYGFTKNLKGVIVIDKITCVACGNKNNLPITHPVLVQE